MSLTCLAMPCLVFYCVLQQHCHLHVIVERGKAWVFGHFWPSDIFDVTVWSETLFSCKQTYKNKNKTGVMSPNYLVGGGLTLVFMWLCAGHAACHPSNSLNMHGAGMTYKQHETEETGLVAGGAGHLPARWHCVSCHMAPAFL